MRSVSAIGLSLIVLSLLLTNSADAHERPRAERGHRTSDRNAAERTRAITQAICDYRHMVGITGPLFLGRDKHESSQQAGKTALEVLVSNGVETRVEKNRPTATPLISHAVLTFNRDNPARADGIVIAAPDDGGFEYKPPHGGPADTHVANWIGLRANKYLRDDLPFPAPTKTGKGQGRVVAHDYVGPYVEGLGGAVDMEAIGRRIRIGVDPMGGSILPLIGPIVARYGLDLSVAPDALRPDSSFDLAFGSASNGSRHLIAADGQVIKPNHFLPVAIQYLDGSRPWSYEAVVGKTLASTSMIDRVAAALHRPVSEVPVGFNWFVYGLKDEVLGFCGDERAGATCLRRDGHVWTTEPDGVMMGLLAAEATVKAGSLVDAYHALTKRHGAPVYERIDLSGSPAQLAALRSLSRETITGTELAGERIERIPVKAPGNNAPIGGLKVVTRNGWFYVHPSGPERLSLVSESFVGQDHLRQIQQDAWSIMKAAGVVEEERSTPW